MLRITYQDQINKLSKKEIKYYMDLNQDTLDYIEKPDGPYEDSLGWLIPEKWASDDKLAELEKKAEEVRNHAEAFVLVGVGGSNNAARAVIKAMERPGMPKVYYAGNSISPHSMNQVLKELQGKSVYINVIAKNFETLEPGIGFRVLRKFLTEQYGERAGERIIATGTPGSWLHELCRKHGFTFLTFPEDIGGRYSALCDVGLFPMAVAGMDIRKLVQGAKDMRQELLSKKGAENSAYCYAAIRNLLYQKGYGIEMLSFFEPRYRYFSKWWIQLFAESEGKEGKGVYPVAAEYSEDLHSTGQFTQEGSPVIYETFLDVVRPDEGLELWADDVDDKFDYLNGKDLWDINKTAFHATIKAHSQKLPVFLIEVEDLNEYCLGQLFYFFEYACYISGELLGINPFDQPGVEAYKSYMFEALKN